LTRPSEKIFSFYSGAVFSFATVDAVKVASRTKVVRGGGVRSVEVSANDRAVAAVNPFDPLATANIIRGHGGKGQPGQGDDAAKADSADANEADLHGPVRASAYLRRTTSTGGKTLEVKNLVQNPHPLEKILRFQIRNLKKMFRLQAQQSRRRRSPGPGRTRRPMTTSPGRHLIARSTQRKKVHEVRSVMIKFDLLNN
jgi:hypothetical protein